MPSGVPFVSLTLAAAAAGLRHALGDGMMSPS
jgi:hypothetical protein